VPMAAGALGVERICLAMGFPYLCKFYVNKGFVGCALRTHLFYCRGQPGVLVTFLASPRKVTQRRRPHSAALRYATGSLRCSVFLPLNSLQQDFSRFFNINLKIAKVNRGWNLNV
jgi:hypothetical protein